MSRGPLTITDGSCANGRTVIRPPRRPRVRCVLAVSILALVTVGSVTSAGAASSRPRVRVPRALVLSNGYQSQLACASPKACVAVGANGVRETLTRLAAVA